MLQEDLSHQSTTVYVPTAPGQDGCFTPALAKPPIQRVEKHSLLLTLPWKGLPFLLTTFNYKMQLSGTSEGFLSMYPSDTAWSAEYTPSEDETTLHTVGKILELLMIIVALAGLAGNVVVLWLLGFRMRRNPFSVYILNLAGADCLFLCCQIILSLDSIVEQQWVSPFL
uniref:G-protein coupled receptors family 1 profile domain-containing protein n=1 Tax=Molossus molossus TaxID=27622 RepID=A0A7J8ESG7_MOLMO|nr:hypothetical protein HJG59_008721 [Molossus molossus]